MHPAYTGKSPKSVAPACKKLARWDEADQARRIECRVPRRLLDARSIFGLLQAFSAAADNAAIARPLGQAGV